ncbi:Histone-lysine N-methyltransferase trr [Echinococcus granulosus]|nr:Histone-lysine N-methyltransferase trr [Echinococcus granulosus]
MSVDHRDALLWLQNENFNKEDYSVGARAFLDNSNVDINCKAELHMGCWAGSTPIKDSSPSSTEPTSMLSDKSSSRGTVETKNSENTCFSTDTGDTEHPTSEGSLSPLPPSQFLTETSNSVSCSLQIAPTELSSLKSEREVSNSSNAAVLRSRVSQMAHKEQFSQEFPLISSNEYVPASAVNDRPPFYNSHSNYCNGPAQNRMGFSEVERSHYHIQSPYGYNTSLDYCSDSRMFFNPPLFSDVPGLPKKHPYQNEVFCQSRPQRFPNSCQQSHPPSPHFWKPNSRPPGLPTFPQDSLDVRRRFAIQQMYQNAQVHRWFPGVAGREFYHQIQDRVRQPHCPWLDPYSHFRGPPSEHTEPLKYTVYSAGGGRLRYPGYALGVNSCGPGRFASPYPWFTDAQHYFSQQKPLRPALESPKKRNASSTRCYKRKRALSVSNVKFSSPKSSTAEVYDSLALSRLLSVNAAQCVSWPELENPIDIYPPEPALKKRKLPCHEAPPNLESLASTDILSRRAQKYTSLPFALRSPGVLNSRDLLSYLNNDQKTKLDSNKNLLSNALAAAITRLSESRLLTTPPSPTAHSSIPDPLNLFTTREEDEATSPFSEIVLPPPKRYRVPESVISEIQSNYQQIGEPTSFPRFCGLRNMRPEKRITMDMIRSDITPMHVCQQCKMQLLFSSPPVSDPTSSPEEVFCSEACMHKYHSTPRLHRPSTAISNTLYADPSIAPVPVLLQNHPSKLCKTIPKSSSIFKCSRRTQRESSLFVPTQRWKGSRWTIFSSSKPPASVSYIDFPAAARKPKPLAFEVLNNAPLPICVLCKRGPDETDVSIVGRYLNYACDKWVHVNCILWCYGVSETIGGCFMNVAKALEQAEHQLCERCSLPGAGVPCFAGDCAYHYHIYCAYKSGCSFYENKSMYCPKHKDQSPSSEKLKSFDIKRRVYLDRDEYALVADVIGTQCLTTSGNRLCLRIGTLILDFLGQLLPEHLESGRFHNRFFIYPVGFSTTRIYWSYRRPSRRCHYICTITDSSKTSRHDKDQKFLDSPPSAHPSPIFTVIVKEHGLPDASFKAGDCNTLWQHILHLVRNSRQEASSTTLRLLPEMLRGESLFGLSEPHIVRAIESLPGVEHLTGYVFKFGKMQLISRMPVMINPTGCARSEPKRRNYVRSCDREREQEQGQGRVSRQNHPATLSPHLGFLRPLNQIPRYCSSSTIVSISLPSGSTSAPAGKQSPSTQYRALQSEWRNNVLLARSKIQGLGLFASRDIEKNEFIIEYLGQLIRNEVGNRRERLYESQSRGIYMFRADDNWIVDATMYGGLARYINHSCEPNCIAEVILYDNQKRIIIIANRLIKKGEELTYDYKLDVETDKGSRIPCLCGSQLCRKWMN